MTNKTGEEILEILRKNYERYVHLKKQSALSHCYREAGVFEAKAEALLCVINFITIVDTDEN